MSGPGLLEPHRAGTGTPGATVTDMSVQPDITQQALRHRSREIVDAVAEGQSFTLTRDGRPIGRLLPLRQPRRFVSRREFAAGSRAAPAVDLDAFRADQDAMAADPGPDDSYAR